MKRLLQALVPLGILSAGIAAALAFYAGKPEAAPKAVDEAITYVEVLEVVLGTHQPTIVAMGIVTAQRQVALAPEVAGRVTEQNPQLVVGGRIPAGDPLIRIDARDYSSAVTASKAALAQANLMVREESSLSRVAEHDWNDRPQGFSEETLAFVMREPHIAAANAQVKSARSRIAKAKRDLSRTIIRAPFDSIVLSETVDIGQPVGPGAPFAVLAGIERYRIEVSLPVAQLNFIAIPEVSTASAKGSTALVHNDAAGGGDTRDGYVIRLHGAVDRRGRMAQLSIAVDDPLGLKLPIESRPLPLLLGTNVRTQVRGRPLKDVAVVPRKALRRDNTVWILDAQQRVQPRSVEVIWREPGVVVIKSGLLTGDRVVTTPLPLATKGMRVGLTPATSGDGA